MSEHKIAEPKVTKPSGAKAARTRWRPSALAVAFLFVCASGVSAAEPFDAQTRAAVQSVVTRQLEALSHGDGKAAEEFATPAIKQRFPEPKQFLAMVQSQYGALIHPKSTQFTDLLSSPHGPLQKVTVVAADGTVWSAIYSFEQVDGQWRISGCGLEKDETQQEI